MSMGMTFTFLFVNLSKNVRSTLCLGACLLQYCAKVMQAIINEYREYRDISAIFNENLP